MSQNIILKTINKYQPSSDDYPNLIILMCLFLACSFALGVFYTAVGAVILTFSIAMVIAMGTIMYYESKAEKSGLSNAS